MPPTTKTRSKRKTRRPSDKGLAHHQDDFAVVLQELFDTALNEVMARLPSEARDAYDTGRPLGEVKFLSDDYSECLAQIRCFASNMPGMMRQAADVTSDVPSLSAMNRSLTEFSAPYLARIARMAEIEHWQSLSFRDWVDYTLFMTACVKFYLKIADELQNIVDSQKASSSQSAYSSVATQPRSQLSR
eukprot:TRINITY_DN89321_c0_g1_i1.p1 TRINITY_DN89321_c0_g1~~TRINITY_DN89321_c0_g1_i1.p1  ORF type:complete len:188 (-),score=11.63 TRINITY_DN89321_c0_g1_i1:123-686(-)